MRGSSKSALQPSPRPSESGGVTRATQQQAKSTNLQPNTTSHTLEATWLERQQQLQPTQDGVLHPVRAELTDASWRNHQCTAPRPTTTEYSRADSAAHQHDRLQARLSSHTTT
ncbi:hypothetical protein GGTG_05243 [Gaeumannomyces tritici R3-111a-1]|uniref:Uncharacterized protein n=1 Tax=Gaeumannomyces tritici (strain R3-111a-1) TaxID=644352 RepID=J3NVD0_GAET3|nr:hypothetical protein GGTG_05243 [Gaeumannomyces tritici R3-111a-1]EJT75306.1 hypothetical protein GGTG_05243 [Gaeumannomyces tritici R3-111a-1]